MNKQRRNAIAVAISEIESIISQLGMANDRVQTIYDDEDCALSNIPESLQGTDRYEQSESACDSLSSAVDSIGEALDSLNSALESLQEIE